MPVIFLLHSCHCCALHLLVVNVLPQGVKHGLKDLRPPRHDGVFDDASVPPVSGLEQLSILQPTVPVETTKNRGISIKLSSSKPRGRNQADRQQLSALWVQVNTVTARAIGQHSRKKRIVMPYCMLPQSSRNLPQPNPTHGYSCTRQTLLEIRTIVECLECVAQHQPSLHLRVTINARTDWWCHVRCRALHWRCFRSCDGTLHGIVMSLGF